MFKKICATDRSGTTIIVRLMVGAVFLSEGVQKFLFPNELGAGRFAKIGLPQPELLAALVGSAEVVCGLLVLLGLFTRLGAIVLMIIMIAAIASTKLKILGEEGFGSMLHDSRTDWSMLLASTFLLLRGGGKWSVDNALWKQPAETRD